MRKFWDIFGFVYPVVIAIITIILFVAWFNGAVSQSFLNWGVIALAFLLFLGKEGVIKSDRNGNALIYTIQYQFTRLKDKLWIANASREASQYGKKVKKERQQILSEINDNGPVSFEFLNIEKGFPAENLTEQLKTLTFYKWAEESGSPVNSSVTHYVITERGKRQLANPGSTDHEPL